MIPPPVVVFSAATADPVRYGMCPSCDRLVPLDPDGTLAPHRAWRMGRAGPHRSDDPCAEKYPEGPSPSTGRGSTLCP